MYVSALLVPLFSLVGGSLAPSLPSAPGEGQAQDLHFAVGTWFAEGVQDWGDGTWVGHKGIVEGRLAEDGLTVERVFWAAFDNGKSLGGRSVHVFDPARATWSGRWIPTTGTWDTTPSSGRFEGERFVSVGRGRNGAGPFTSTARFFDIARESYRVEADLFHDTGAVSRRNWQCRFKRVHDSEATGSKSWPGPQGSLDFLLGEWVAEGSLILPDGTKATHRSYVDARLAEDGHSIVREFWGALSTGAPLRGLATHSGTLEPGAWDSSWTPAGSSAPASTSLGRFEADEFVELREQGPQASGGRATWYTRYFDIAPMSYRVQSDILFESGKESLAVWTVRFQRFETREE